ncbi:FAD-dependent monooxygenase [Streptomyces sp. NRRL WC-3742]|uniref:FAD-dependent monooxygenase n=1 Tax=Streptomyces sp. NRRL WC-3742 TaxID=1463934 RepID=UPI0004C8B5F6|nr:FAD-dependent monooxygenase [Streptomyces sp. NRRL WC-3742]
MTPIHSTSVLIAGGGPVGLATAVELGTRGIDCTVLEPRTVIAPLRPRAKSSSARTMEHFRRWGLADRLRKAASLPVSLSQQAVYCSTLLGHEITRVDECFGLTAGRRDVFSESGQQVAQPVVETVLREAIAELPTVRLALGWKLTGCSQTDSAVLAEATDENGEARQITADYLVGCDGPDSTTRAAIGGRLEGTADARANRSIIFRAPGLAERVPHGPAVHYWIVNSRFTGVMGRMNLEDVWWINVSATTMEQDGLMTPEALVQAYVGAPLDCEVLATSTWHARMQLADNYQRERIFLAGDAAHLNPPWGGHGYNTGVGDAVNIGWKLAAALQGWGGPELLRSYQTERRAVAQETIALTTATMRASVAMRPTPALESDGADGEQARSELAKIVWRTMEGEFHSLGLVLGYAYPHSSVVVPDESDASDDIPVVASLIDYEPSTRPGARLPHAWLPDGRSLYDLLGAGLTLLVHQESDIEAWAETAERRGVPLTVVRLDGLLPAPDSGTAALLVRPDQHIAWRGTGKPLTADEADAVLARVTGMPG